MACDLGGSDARERRKEIGVTDKTADTVADELLARLEHLRVIENERALYLERSRG